VILVRQDLKMPKGKVGAQVGHACVEATLRSGKETVRAWRNEGMKKVVLKVKDEKELLKYMQMAKDNRLVTALITDAGRTIVEPGTKTCVGIGPALEDDIDAVTGELTMM